ncbi:MAG: hypothetical protein ACLR6J_04415 [Parabacteroides merdae]
MTQSNQYIMRRKWRNEYAGLQDYATDQKTGTLSNALLSGI